MITAERSVDTPVPRVASPSQLSAIEADLQALLVLAGPGAGKTFCLIERIRFLIEKREFDPARICAFTFTNKAAGEIASRLEKQLGSRAGRVKRGTIHAFCAELLREFGQHVGLEPGFGIADEEYQRSVLWRLQVPPRWHGKLLTQICAHRFRGDSLDGRDATAYERYREFLERRNLVDFDMLVLKAAELLRLDEVATTVRRRWECVLVDEFQDLNRTQYAIIKALAEEHRNIFAVGDDEQSIYSWAGADPQVFTLFLNDFGARRIQIGENRRCPRAVVTLARRLINSNTPIFADERQVDATRDSPFAVAALSFATEDTEIAWIIDDIRRDREEHGLKWGDFALLYRRHEIGNAAESGFLTAGVPVRLAPGRALAEDPIVRYVIAALRVIARPDDEIPQENFLQVVLPRSLFGSARAKAGEAAQGLIRYLEQHVRELPADDDTKNIWRGLFALQNLAGLGTRHTNITGLVDELLSEPRVGVYRTPLEEINDEISDPAAHHDVQRLAHRLLTALDTGRTVWIPRLGGMEIALKAILQGILVWRIQLGGACPPDAVSIVSSDASSLGLALTVFKAAQLVRSRKFRNSFGEFTTVDIETTDKDIERSEVVDIAAARVRDEKIVGQFHSLVKPRVPITEGAREVHRISEADVADAPFFEDVWPRFREFCGGDILVAHNGYQFDFPILRRMSKGLPGPPFVTYDTFPLARELHTGSAKLVDLARAYGIDTGQSHRALDDTITLAHLFLALGEAKIVRARKTALPNLLDQLGIALALGDVESLGDEAKTLFRIARYRSLGRYSRCLESYGLEREQSGDNSIASVEDLIERLGGERLMLRLRSDRSAEERYPAAMARLRPLLDQSTGTTLSEQIVGFLDRVALSKRDGEEPDLARVNLLTLHSTKGLEFSRVYIVGAEDSEIPGGRDPHKWEIEEARRLLYVGMTRTMDRLVLTRVEARGGKPTGGHRFLDEMGLVPRVFTPSRRT